MKNLYKSALLGSSALVAGMAPVALAISCGETGNGGVSFLDTTFDIGTNASFAPYNFTLTSEQYIEIERESLLIEDNLETDITPAEAREFLQMIAPVQGASDYAAGYDIYVSKLVAEKFDQDVIVHIKDFPSLIDSMTQRNEFDAIAADMSYTDERAKRVYFTVPYYKPKNSILYRKDRVTSDVQTSHFKFATDENGLPVRSYNGDIKVTETTSKTVIGTTSETTWFDIAQNIPHSGDIITGTDATPMEISMLAGNDASTDNFSKIDGLLYEDARAQYIADKSRRQYKATPTSQPETIYQVQRDNNGNPLIDEDGVADSENVKLVPLFIEGQPVMSTSDSSKQAMAVAKLSEDGKLIPERSLETFGTDNINYQSHPDDKICMAFPINKNMSSTEGVRYRREVNEIINKVSFDDREEKMSTAVRLASYVNAL